MSLDDKGLPFVRWPWKTLKAGDQVSRGGGSARSNFTGQRLLEPLPPRCTDVAGGMSAADA